MAFNLNFYKGTTTAQAQSAIEYWQNALKSNEEVEKMKMEKQKLIEENAVVYPDGPVSIADADTYSPSGEGPVGVAHVESEPIGPCGTTGTNNLIEQ